MQGRVITVCGAVLLSLACASPARASSVSVTSGQLRYVAAGGETNQLLIEQGASSFRVVDSGATVTVGAGCTTVSATRAQCAVSGITSLSLTAGDQDDVVRATSTLPTTVSAGAGIDDVTTGGGNDVVDLGPSTGASYYYELESAATGAGADKVTARNPATLTLGTGADIATLLGSYYSFNSVTVYGGPDNDTLDASAMTSPGATLLGEGGQDILRAARGGSGLAGGDGNDTLTGGAGDDVLQGGAGTDALTGAAGRDAASYSDHAAAVTVTVDNVANDGSSGEGENVRTDIEGIVGGGGNDTLTPSSSAAGVQLAGCGGNDTLNGTPGDDTLEGDSMYYYYMYYLLQCTYVSSPGVDKLNGGAGDDNLGTMAGADVADGGTGLDFASFSSASAPVTATLDNVANDGVASQAANVKSTVEGLQGGSANDTLTGNASANTLLGGGGADVLNGGDGGDVLCGASGYFYTFYLYYGSPLYCDTFAYGDGADTLNAGAGDDTLLGGVGADVYNGGTGADIASFTGSAAAVTVSNDGVANDGVASQAANVKTDVEGLVGGSYADTLTGGANADVLNGGTGNDTLLGGGGRDLLLGGAGSTYFGSDADVLNGGTGVDTASFADHPAYPGVTVTIDGAANDGLDSEGDNVKGDVENVTGTQGNDSLTGNSLANVLLGRGGSDVLTGGLGNDVLDGGLGFGDQLFGGDGVDALQSRDGNTGETVDCGAGTTDSAVTDSGDSVSGCESNSAAPTAAPSAATPAEPEADLGERAAAIVQAAASAPSRAGSPPPAAG